MEQGHRGLLVPETENISAVHRGLIPHQNVHNFCLEMACI